MQSHSRKQKGFTIVELLIVVVIIAILAAITIVSYNGITSRAKQATVNSAASTAAKKVQLYAVENSDAYPTALTQVAIQGSDKPNQTTYRYTANNTATSRSYCITATNGTTRVYISNTTTSPQTGSCPGHDDDTNYVTNQVTNPSFENNLDGWEAFGGATIERTTEQAATGQYSLKVTPTSSNSGARMATLATVTPSTQYSVCLKIRLTASVPSPFDANEGVFGAYMLTTGGGSTAQSTISQASPVNTWITSCSTQLTTQSAATVKAGVAYWPEGAAAVAPFYIDDVSFIKGAAGYLSGDSPGWIWNGTPGSSTSTGPRQ